MGMTEQQVRQEWEQAAIGRPITQSEIDNWTRHGSEGQLRGELGREGTTEEARQHSNEYHEERNQWDKLVNVETGDPLSGWRDPNTGTVSLNPMGGFGEGSEPLWGEGAAQHEKVKRAISLFDEQTEAEGFNLETDTFGAGGSSVEGDWIAIPVGVKVNEDRLTAIPDAVIGKEGEQRQIYQKVSKRKKYGIFGKEISEHIPGDIQTLVAEGAELASLGAGGAQLLGGTELSSRVGRTAGKAGAAFGLDEEDTQKLARKVQQAAPVIAAGIAGTATGGPALGAQLATAVQTAQMTGKGAVAELQGFNPDWAEIAEQAAINAGISIAVPYAGKVAGTTGVVGANAAIAKSRGADWTEVAYGAAFDVAGMKIARNPGEAALLKTTEGVVLDKEFEDILLSSIATYGTKAATEAKRFVTQVKTKDGRIIKAPQGKVIDTAASKKAKEIIFIDKK